MKWVPHSDFRSRARRLPVALVLALALGALPAYGFCPNNGYRCGFGISGRTHEDITRTAIESFDKGLFHRTELTTGMRHALDEVVAANAAVDLEESQVPSANHFDGENFPGGKLRVVTLTDDLVAKLQADKIVDARKKLGSLLHTLQDFFSHSDWIETGHNGSNPAVWEPGTPLAPLAGDLADTCEPCEIHLFPVPVMDCTHNLLTAALTSGYYNGSDVNEDRQPATSKKCRHGGLKDHSPGPLGGLNKDTVFIDFSPHNMFHSLAASAATEATEDYLEYLRTRISDRELERLLGAGPTLAIAIDTTGSMGKEIEGVRDQSIQIVDARLGTDEEPSLYVLAPFNDPSIGPLTVTSDAEEFKAAIRALGPSGGGDCAELAMGGMLAALGASLEDGKLFVFTDADAKDASLAGNVVGLAAEKNIQIYPLLFGSCSGGRSLQGTGKTFAVDSAFTRVAAETGGQLFLLAPDEAGQITRLADAVVRSNAVDLLAVADTFGGTAKSYSVPVDSTLTRLTFVLTGTPALALTRPDGSPVRLSDPGVDIASVDSGVAITVTAPQAGLWQASATGLAGGAFSLGVKGEGSLSFDHFDFVELRGGAHPGYGPIEGLPVVGDAITASALLSGPVASAQFELRSRKGELLQVLGLAPDTDSGLADYFGTVPLPAEPFVAYARGTDSGGKAYQRVIVKAISPQTLRVLEPARQDLVAGRSLTYTFEVKNSGPAGTFRAIASDDQGFVASVSPVQFDLAKNRKVKVSVRLTAPAGSEGVSDTLTLAVESLPSGGARNFAVVTSQVVVPPAP